MARFGLTLSNRGVNLGLTTSDEILGMAERADAAGAMDRATHESRLNACRGGQNISMRHLRVKRRVQPLWFTNTYPAVIRRTGGEQPLLFQAITDQERLEEGFLHQILPDNHLGFGLGDQNQL